jgi:hypothetical protein
MLHILAPRRREFGCGVCDQNEVVVSRLRAAGVQVHTTHFNETGYQVPDDVRPGDVVFLQFSIYGFAKRGAPIWLPDVLRRLKSAGARVVTFFHELWVRWPRVTSSAFWLAPVQRAVCERTLALSDTAIFNVERGYEWARRRKAQRDIRYIRTFSNVGEPDIVPPWATRQDNMVVFGNPKARVDIYRALLESIPHLAGRVPLGIIDLGQPAPDLDRYIGDRGSIHSHFRSIERAGPLPGEAVGRILVENKFGLFAAPWGHAGKSSVLAAYMAHRMCPVSIYDRSDTRAPALLPPKPSVHFALLHNMDLQTAHMSSVFAAIADTAYHAYQSSHHVVALLRDALAEPVRQPLVIP